MHCSAGAAFQYVSRKSQAREQGTELQQDCLTGSESYECDHQRGCQDPEFQEPTTEGPTSSQVSNPTGKPTGYRRRTKAAEVTVCEGQANEQNQHSKPTTTAKVWWQGFQHKSLAYWLYSKQLCTSNATSFLRNVIKRGLIMVNSQLHAIMETPSLCQDSM